MELRLSFYYRTSDWTIGGVNYAVTGLTDSICQYGQQVIFVFFCRGNNSAKNVGGATVVNLCMSSVMLYISTKFCEIISIGIKVTEWTRFLY